MSLERFAKFAAMKHKRCTSKDISDKSTRGVTSKCLPLFKLKGRLGSTSEGTIPPGSGVEVQSPDLAASRTGR